MYPWRIAYVVVGLFLLSIITVGSLSFAESDVTKKPLDDLRDRLQSNFQEFKERGFIVVYRDAIKSSDIEDLREKSSSIKSIFQNIKAVSINADEGLIGLIKQNRNVFQVYEDLPAYLLLDESVPQINAIQVHDLGVTGNDVKVCIVDTGISNSHPSLPPIVAQHDFFNGDTNADDDHGHGTHVAGIVASSHSVYGGVAPGVSLMAAKVLSSSGSGSASGVIAGIEWCVANGADVINLSLGINTGGCETYPTSTASNSAVDSGVLVVAASGNSGASEINISPACAEKVMAIGAVTKSDERTAFSNEGSKLDLVAPGVSIVSTVPTGGCDLCSSDGLNSLTGTSMASPHVAATAALVLEDKPTLSPFEVQSILRGSAFDLGSLGCDTIYGYGRVDALASYNFVPIPPPPITATFYDDFEGTKYCCTC